MDILKNLELIHHRKVEFFHEKLLKGKDKIEKKKF